MKANGIQWYVVRALALAVGFCIKRVAVNYFKHKSNERI